MSEWMREGERYTSERCDDGRGMCLMGMNEQL